MSDRTMSRIWWLGLGIGLSLGIVGGRSSPRLVEAGQAPSAEAGANNPMTLSVEELHQIQRRLDQLTENHQQLLKTLEAIKAELAIIKVRVTQ